MPVDINLPPVVGDPVGMRMLATELRGDATSLAMVAADVASTVDALEFYGPAADRIDASVHTSSRNGGRLAERLLAVATLLDRAAGDVEVQQRERERKLEQLRREAAQTVTR
jgi:hypothetical protein